MTYHSNLVVQIAKQICRHYHCSGSFDDLCQTGEMTANRLRSKTTTYIAKAVRRAMLKEVPKRQPESLRDCDYPAVPDIELSTEFYIHEYLNSGEDRDIFCEYYLKNIPIKEIAKSRTISESSVYRILSRLKKDLVDAI